MSRPVPRARDIQTVAIWGNIMDYARNHAIRRRIYRTLERQQESESRLAGQVQDLTTQFYRKELEDLAEWLDCIPVDGASYQGERAIIQRIPNFDLAKWLEKRGE